MHEVTAAKTRSSLSIGGGVRLRQVRRDGFRLTKSGTINIGTGGTTNAVNIGAATGNVNIGGTNGITINSDGHVKYVTALPPTTATVISPRSARARRPGTGVAPALLNMGVVMGCMSIRPTV